VLSLQDNLNTGDGKRQVLLCMLKNTSEHRQATVQNAGEIGLQKDGALGFCVRCLAEGELS